MRKIIEKFYSIIFEDKESAKTEPVPYANKVFMFYFSIITFTTVIILITTDIIKNIKALNVASGQ